MKRSAAKAVMKRPAAKAIMKSSAAARIEKRPAMQVDDDEDLESLRLVARLRMRTTSALTNGICGAKGKRILILVKVFGTDDKDIAHSVEVHHGRVETEFQ